MDPYSLKLIGDWKIAEDREWAARYRLAVEADRARRQTRLPARPLLATLLRILANVLGVSRWPAPPTIIQESHVAASRAVETARRENATVIDVRKSDVQSGMIYSPVITPRTTVATALRLLREHDVPALPVCEGGRFVGLVRENSLLRLTPSEATTLDVYELRDLLDKLTVSHIIEPVPAIASDASLEDAAVLMRAGRHEVLPVTDGGRFAGLLPWTALLQEIAA